MRRVHILLRHLIELAMLPVRIIVDSLTRQITQSITDISTNANAIQQSLKKNFPKDCRAEINNILVRKKKTYLISSVA